MNAAQIRERFAETGYIADEDFATTLELMLALEKPLLVEGPAGVGKTESAKVLAGVLDTRLIRLQCYEGLDSASALYEWNYPKQLLRIRLTEHQGIAVDEREAQIFGREFLLERPLLESISQERAPVLLIDEIDRADEAFEAFLLEVLGEFQVTDSGNRDATRGRASEGRCNVESNARSLRRAATALSLFVDRLSIAGARSRDPARAASGHQRPARAADRALHGVSARATIPARAGNRREPRLGAGARATPSRRARRSDACSDDGLHFKSPGGLGAAAQPADAVCAVARPGVR